MRVLKIDYENKTFMTEDSVEYPFVFGLDENISLAEFQKIVDESKCLVENILGNE